jgi:hypothetical protein
MSRTKAFSQTRDTARADDASCWLNNMRALIPAFLLCLFLVGCSDVVTSHYETYNDAVSDHLFVRGWLPEFIPSSSFNITTANDLDLGTSEGEFSFNPVDAQTFALQLQAYSGPESPCVKKRTGQGYAPYEYKKGNSTWVFFINTDKGHVYYYLRVER